MHIVDLAIIPDLAISLLLDWSDNRDFVNLGSRHARLDWLASRYRAFVGNDSDRANWKLFTVEVLKPGATSFASVSQHYLSAAAAKGLLIWLTKMAQEYAALDPSHTNQLPGKIHTPELTCASNGKCCALSARSSST